MEYIYTSNLQNLVTAKMRGEQKYKRVRQIRKYCKFHKEECYFTPYSTTCMKRRIEKRDERVEKMIIPGEKDTITLSNVD